MSARLDIETPHGLAWVDLDRPRAAKVLLALGHGAGGSVDAPDLIAVRDAAVANGFAVARITQPYRVAGRRGVAPANQLDTAWLAALAAVRKQRGLARLPLVVGGRSSGARVACRTAAEAGAAAVVVLAFPLHPPGKPQRSRLPELAQVSVPVLVVQGDRDPFGMPPAAPGRRVVVIEGADHGLKKGSATIADAVIDFISSLR
jgi:uncharacterized protein